MESDSYAIDLPNPPSGSFDKERHMGFRNIQTISYLSLRYCTKEVISGIQNVKKLGINEDENDEDTDYEDNVKSLPKLGGLLHNLHQLETLSVRFYDITPSAKDFPATLKKLKLDLTFLYLSELDIIAELPNLEVLKLEVCDFWGNEMYPIVGVFTRLKHLLIRSSKLKYLNVTNDNFPVLEHLVLDTCFDLDKIPIEFADIQSLQLIDIKDCTPELEASAARIQQEQEELGNKPVDVRIISSRQLQLFLMVSSDLQSVVEHTIQLRLKELVTRNDEMQIEKIHERLRRSLIVSSKSHRSFKKQALKESLLQDSSSNPSFNFTNAQGVCPRWLSGRATTAATRTAG